MDWILSKSNSAKTNATGGGAAIIYNENHFKVEELKLKAPEGVESVFAILTPKHKVHNNIEKILVGAVYIGQAEKRGAGGGLKVHTPVIPSQMHLQLLALVVLVSGVQYILLLSFPPVTCDQCQFVLQLCKTLMDH